MVLRSRQREKERALRVLYGIGLFIRNIDNLSVLNYLYCSFMMVGDPFSGKTSVLKVLAEAMTTLHERGSDDENINKVMRPF